MRRFAALVILVLLAFGVAIPALGAGNGNGPPDDLICDGLDSGKIDTVGNPATVTVTAPVGFLIDSYCVKAGPGFVIVVVAPPASIVVIDHPDKDSVSHYSYSLVEAPTTTVPEETTTTTTIVETTTTTVGETTTTNAEETTTTTQPSESTTTLAEAETTTTAQEESTTTLGAPTTTNSVTNTTVCTEDMECWDCEVNGNRQCAPVLPFTGIDPGWAFLALGLIILGTLVAASVSGDAFKE